MKRPVALVLLASTWLACAAEPRATSLSEPPTGTTTAALTWRQESDLPRTDGANGDDFGTSVAVCGDLAVVGAAAASTAGAAYLFRRSGTAWTFEKRLEQAVPVPFSAFGSAVACDGGTVVVGAWVTGAGSAHVFTQDAAGTWAERKKLVATDGANNDELGISVAVSGGTIAVGADGRASRRGAVLVFVASGADWVEQTKLVAADGAAGDAFGRAVAISGDTVVVGAPSKGSRNGAAYVFTRTGGSWSGGAALTPSPASTGMTFGASVAIDGDHVLVGAPEATTSGGPGFAGAAYAFARTGGVFAQAKRLVASDAAVNDGLGVSVAVSGAWAAAGARRKTSKTGAAYAFATSTWTEDRRLAKATPAKDDAFGASVAASADTIVVGAPHESFAMTPGEAFAFRAGKVEGETCGAAGECLSRACVDGVCCDTPCGGGAADCQACSVAAGAPKDGVCSPLPATRVCRPAASTCDVEDRCDGISGACPADAVSPNGTPCTDGVCQAGRCTGSISAPGPSKEPPAATAESGAAGGDRGCSASHAPARGSAFGLLAVALVLSQRRRRR